MFTEGHITLKRTLKLWRWYQDPKVFALFVHMLIDANFTDTEWESRTIKRGQLVTSVPDLSRETGLSIQEVRTGLRKLRLTRDISQEFVGRMTLVTLCNYDKYQGEQRAINGQATGNQQADNLLLTPIQPAISEEGKKEIREEVKAPVAPATPKKKFVKPTVEQVRAFCQEKGYNINPETFVSFYESKGWVVGKSPMKDWQAAVRQWVSRDRDGSRLSAPVTGGLFPAEPTQREEPKSMSLQERIARDMETQRRQNERFLASKDNSVK